MPWWGLALVLAAWSLGIAGAVLLSPLAPWLLLGGVLLVAAAIFNRDVALLVGATLIALLLGSARGLIAPPVQLPADVTGQSVTLSGRVDDDPVARNGRQRLTVRADHVMTLAGQLPSRLRILVTVYGAADVSFGDLVLLTGELEAPPRFEQYDYRGYLAEQGIAGVMPSARLVRRTSGDVDAGHRALFWLRHAVIETVGRVLPEPQGGLVLGVVFGYRAALPAALEQQMIASGLIHIVVASGLNVVLLTRLVQAGLGQWWPRASAAMTIALVTSYTLLAGASPAALRAAMMGALVLLASALKRDSHVIVSIALAAALMLGLQPSLARDAGFQLSFTATLGIIAWADAIAGRLRHLPGALREALAATLAAQSLTWPVLLAQVHQVSLIAPLANVLVVPLLPFIMVAGGLGALAGGLWLPAGWLPLQAAGAVARWFQLVIETTGSLPVAALRAPYFPPGWLAAAAILNGGALLAIKLRRFFWQEKIWAALGGLGLLAAALFLVRPDGRVHVYALDIGTGSGVLVRTAGGSQLLIDGGPDADRFTQAIGRALPPTARSIETWLITGGRRAQIGAASAVLKRFHIGRIMVAEPDPWSPTLRTLVLQAQSVGIPVALTDGTIALDDVRLTMAADGRTWLIHAERGVMAVVAPRTSWRSLPAAIDGAIFTGGGPVEWQGPGRGFSVIQVADRSRDGLPVRALLLALQGAPLYRTGRLGTIEFVATGAGFSRPK